MGVQVNSYFKSKYTGAQIENMLDAFGNTAAAYETSTAYSVGDLVLYNNALYVCTGATTGAFDPSKWQQTTLAELVENLGATYTDPNNDGNVVVGVDSTTGEKILRSISFPSLTNRYYLPFAQYIRTQLANDPASASFDVEIPDAEEAPMHSTVIKGKTVAVNQLSHDVADSSGSQSDVSYVWSSNKITLNGTATSNFIHSIGGGWQYDDIPAGHTVLLVPCITGSNGYPTTEFAFRASDNTIFLDVNIVYPTITTLSDSANRHVENIRAVSGTSFSNYTTTHPMVIDLNNSPVASRLAEIGTDVAKLKQVWLEEKGEPLPFYIPYDAGSLANVNGEYRVRGRNLWDEETTQGYVNTDGEFKTATNQLRTLNYVPLVGGTAYYVKTPNTLQARYFDANKVYISGTNVSGLFTPPENACYAIFNLTTTYGTTYKNDICINLSDASFNGTYEKYYNGGTIDCSAAPLNGFDDTVCDVKDFATGERITRFPLVDLGTLNWSYVGSGATARFDTNIADMLIPSSRYTAVKALCGLYVAKPWDYVGTDDTGFFAAYVDDGNNRHFAVRDTRYTDAATFKSAMSGVMLGYEAATPTTSTETPQPLETQYGYNVFEPVSGGVQSADVDTVYYENIAGYIDKKIGA